MKGFYIHGIDLQKILKPVSYDLGKTPGKKEKDGRTVELILKISCRPMKRMSYIFITHEIRHFSVALENLNGGLGTPPSQSDRAQSNGG
jgi:hypothetical protein